MLESFISIGSLKSSFYERSQRYESQPKYLKSLRSFTKYLLGWRPLLQELTVEGANVHFFSSDRRTLFLYLFEGLALDMIWDYSASDHDLREIMEPTKLMESTTNHLSEPNAWTANMT